MQRTYRFLQWTLTVVMGITLLSAAVQPASAADSVPAPAAQGPGERRGYHPQTGMLTFLGASPDQPIAVAGATGPDLALDVRGEAILQAYAGEFGIRNPSEELTLARQSVSANGQQTVRYQQVYQGVPVMGGELIVNMNENGELLSMNGEVSPGLALSTAPRVSADAARAAALALVAKYYNLKETDLNVTEPELWIYDPRLLIRSNSPAELVWRMDVTAAGAPVRQLVLIGAEKGKVSLTFNQIDTAWVGAGAYSAPAASSAPASEAPSAALVLGTPNLQTNDLGGTMPDPISGGALLCSNSMRNCGSGDTDGDAAHAYAYDTYMAYANLHSRDSIDGAGMTIKSYVHFGVGYQNAFWDGAEMVYGDGFSAADDVVGHELTHGVTQNESNLFYYWESGAINESFSDVWGEYVDQINGYGTDTSAVKWLMGEDVPGFGAIRNMKNPPAFGDPDSMTSSRYCKSGICYDYDNGGVHYNSGVNNKAVFLMVDGGSFNSKVVSPLGWTKTLTVYYEAQTNLLTSASGYYDLYYALYQACVNKIGTSGITTADCQEVRDATDAVRMNKEPATGFNPNAEACLTGYSPYPMFEEDFESGTAGWTFGANPTLPGTSANWSLWSASPWFWGDPYSTSGVESMYADDDDGSGFADYAPNDSWIVSSPISLPAGTNPYLIFSHQFLLDYYASSYYDGGVLEYSTDSGSTWYDAAPLFSGGQNYKGTLSTWDGSNALGGRKAFTGDSHGWVDSRYKLTSLVGQTVWLRWRMGNDSSLAFWGWFIDDIVVNDCLQIPSVPALLSPATNALITDYTPLLDWKDSTGDLDHYWLQVDDNNDFSSPHFDAGVGSTSSWEITPGNMLNPNTKYYWRVKAFDAAGGESNWSAVRYFRTAILPPAFLSAPSDTVVLQNKRPFFDWDAVPGATGYTLQVSRESDFAPLFWTRNSTTDSYTSTTDLPADTLFYWRVRTSGPNGPSDWTGPWSFTTGNPPSIPALVSPANNALLTDYTPLLDWNASTAPAGTTLSYYEVQVDDDPAFGSLAYNAGISATATSIETDPLSPGTKYYWRVRAFNTDSEYSAWSLVRYFRTAFLPPNLVSPVDNALLLNLRPTFDWDPVAGATNYTLQVSKNNTFTQLVLNKVVTPDTYTPTVNLPAGIPLYWRVRANGPFGPSAYADYRTLTVSSLSGDDDGDSLPNDWEINGYDANGDSIIDVDLPALGADYRHKDLFVEMDYMDNLCGGNHTFYGLAPNATVISAIETVFDNAPVTNPDGTTGINIHLELDDMVTCDSDLNPVWTDFFAIKAANFDPNRTAVYHYMLWANAYSGGTSSGLAQLPGTDFIVTLGSWANGGGTDPQKIGTFIHELGHNLDLTHGGSDHNHYKPNYLSVMNYFFQTIGLYRDGHWGEDGSAYYDRFDYQRFNTTSLNENALKESLGLNTPAASTYGTVYFCPGAVDQWDRTNVLVASPIDWNCDGDTLDTAVVDINFSGGRGTLTTQNNWLNLTFDGFGVIGSGLSPDQLSVLAMSNTNAEYDELTLEIQQQVDLLRSQP